MSSKDFKIDMMKALIDVGLTDHESADTFAQIDQFVKLGSVTHYYVTGPRPDHSMSKAVVLMIANQILYSFLVQPPRVTWHIMPIHNIDSIQEEQTGAGSRGTDIMVYIANAEQRSLLLRQNSENRDKIRAFVSRIVDVMSAR